MLRIVRSNRGMSILEVMVASGLVMVLFLGISELVRFSAKSAKSVGLSTDFSNVVSAVQQVLDQEQTCTYTLQGLSINPATLSVTNPVNVPEIKTQGGGTVVKLDNTASGLKTTILRFENVMQDLGTRMDGNKAFIARLHLQVEKKAVSGQAMNVGSPTMDSYFNVTMIQNPSGSIERCYRVTSAADICNTLGPTHWDSTNERCNIIGPVCITMGGVPTPQGSASPTACDFRAKACDLVGGRPVPEPPAPFERCDIVGNQRVSCTAVNGRYVGIYNPLDPPVEIPVCDICTHNGAIFIDKGNGSFTCDYCTPAGGLYDKVTGKCDMCTPRGIPLKPDKTTCDYSGAICSAWGGTPNGSGGCALPYSPNGHDHPHDHNSDYERRGHTHQ